MSLIRGYDTKPELIVRSILHGMGYRFRIHQDKLPGNPDIVLRKYSRVIFVHGCFWHGHKGCLRAKRPATHKAFWADKLDKNIARDKTQQRQLKTLGWKYSVIWQCEVDKKHKLRTKLMRFLTSKR